MSASLKWTGERLVPSILDEVAVEHLARYAFCLPLIEGKKILDLACGEGYGSFLMAEKAAEVTGVDIDENTIDHAQKKYTRQNLTFAKGSVLSLPIKAGLFDVVVSFETIEHLKEQEQMLDEIKRVLKPDGLLIISTPNKKISEQKDLFNKYHKKEMDKGEFKTLLNHSFKNIQLFFQQNMYGTAIYPENMQLQNITEAAGNFQYIQSQNNMANPCYFISVASNVNLPISDALFFNAANVYEERFTTLKNTGSYKLGAALLSPYKWIRSLVNK